MLSAGEILHNGYGAWRLLLGDASGLRHIDGSARGMRRSFLLAPLLLPFFALEVLLHAGDIAATASWPRVVAIELSAYAIGWSAFPLAIAGVVRMIDREREYDGFIAAYNWSNLVQFALVMPLLLLDLVDILPDSALQILYIILTLVLLGYGWFIARTALRLQAFGAIGIVALDFAIGFLVNAIADLLIA